MNESMLTRFTLEHPCWTAELLERAGEDAADLGELERAGFLLRLPSEGAETFALTDAGRGAFADAAADMFLDERPGEPPADPERCLMTTELWLELERTNLQRWGLKRYLVRPGIPARPALPREKVWSVGADGLKWNYLDDPVFKSVMDAHPAARLRERDLNPRGTAALEAWEKLPADSFSPDLLYITNYDFENYLDFRGHPGDRLKLINTDRFAFSAAPETRARLDVLGAMHRVLWTLRRLEIPGWLDVDSHEQDSVNWLIFFTRTQRDAEAARAELKKFGESLIAPVNPMEVWTLSLENLRKCPARQEVIWDVLPQYGLPVCLTL